MNWKVCYSLSQFEQSGAVVIRGILHLHVQIIKLCLNKINQILFSTIVFKHFSTNFESFRDYSHWETYKKSNKDQATKEMGPDIYCFIVACEKTFCREATRVVIDTIANFYEFVVLNEIRSLWSFSDKGMTHFINVSRHQFFCMVLSDISCHRHLRLSYCYYFLSFYSCLLSCLVKLLTSISKCFLCSICSLCCRRWNLVTCELKLHFCLLCSLRRVLTNFCWSLSDVFLSLISPLDDLTL